MCLSTTFIYDPSLLFSGAHQQRRVCLLPLWDEYNSPIELVCLQSAGVTHSSAYPNAQRASINRHGNHHKERSQLVAVVRVAHHTWSSTNCLLKTLNTFAFYTDSFFSFAYTYSTFSPQLLQSFIHLQIGSFVSCFIFLYCWLFGSCQHWSFVVLSILFADFH